MLNASATGFQGDKPLIGNNSAGQEPEESLQDVLSHWSEFRLYSHHFVYPDTCHLLYPQPSIRNLSMQEHSD